LEFLAVMQFALTPKAFTDFPVELTPKAFADFPVELTPKALANFRLELTPKALANFSPGFEEREPWEPSHQKGLTLKGFANRLTLTGFGPSLGI